VKLNSSFTASSTFPLVTSDVKRSTKPQTPPSWTINYPDIHSIMETNLLVGKINDMAISNNQGVDTAKEGDARSQLTDATTTKNRKKKEARKRKKVEENTKKLEEAELLATAAAENAQVLSITDKTTPKIGIGEALVGTSKTDAMNNLFSTLNYAFLVKAVPGKGLGMFATKNIKAGTKFFKERPLIASIGEWLRVEASCASLDSETAEKYLWPLMSRCHCGQNPCRETPVMRLWDTNQFEIPREIQDISTAYSTEEKSISCVYAVASYINHACNSNSSYGFTKDLDIVFFAQRNISRGEEITHSYGAVFGPVQFRREVLLTFHHFHCKCTACDKGQTVANDNAPNCVEISESDVEHLKTVTVVDAASQQRVKLANEWGMTAFEHLITCIKRMWLVGKIKGATRWDRSFLEHATADIIKQHGDWLKLHNHFDCMGETIKLDDDVIRAYLERLPNIVRDHFHRFETLPYSQFPAGSFFE
jgi:hypothetical protein